MFRIYRVRGNSMLPTLNEGDYVVALGRLVSRLFKPTVGKLVVVDHPEHGVMIKRIATVSNDELELSGDNQGESLSTKAMGKLDRRAILGRVIYVSKQKT